MFKKHSCNVCFVLCLFTTINLRDMRVIMEPNYGDWDPPSVGLDFTGEGEYPDIVARMHDPVTGNDLEIRVPWSESGVLSNPHDPCGEPSIYVDRTRHGDMTVSYPLQEAPVPTDGQLYSPLFEAQPAPDVTILYYNEPEKYFSETVFHDKNEVKTWFYDGEGNRIPNPETGTDGQDFWGTYDRYERL